MKPTFFIIDTETTGLDPERCEIIQFAGVKVCDGLILDDRINVKIKPQHIETASSTALRINGYTEKGWADADSPEEAALTITDWLTGDEGGIGYPPDFKRILVGHNIRFDYRFLRPFLEEYERAIPFSKICTKDLSMALLSSYGLERFRLSDCCSFMGVVNAKPHDAMSDALACADLLLQLLSRFHY